MAYFINQQNTDSDSIFIYVQCSTASKFTQNSTSHQEMSNTLLVLKVKVKVSVFI